MVLRSRSKNQNTTTTTTTVDNDDIIENQSDNITETSSSPSNSSAQKFSYNRFDLSKLKEEQENDSIIQNIVTKIHIRKNNLPFVVKNNIVYKLINTFTSF